ncbi:MAG TPA: glycosyltransferase, partial [Acidimicrobiales bacterium]|nr:glycosyltransferase [Acidimicrobiales bacterium]
MAGSTAERSPQGPGALRVLRVSHSSVVTAWRHRERELRRRGVEVRLLSAARWEEGGALVRLEAAGDDFVRPVATFGRHPNLFVYDPRPLWRELGDGGWDVLDLHEEPFALATAEVLLLRRLRRRRMPYVLYSAQNLDKRYPPPFRWLERWSLRRAGGAYPANEETARILRRKGLRGPAVVIPLGVDLERFSPAARPPPEGRLRVGFVGRLVPEKGVDVLLRAAARDPRLDLVVVGGGPEEARLRELAAELGLGGRVAFCGPVDESSTPEVYRSLDALAVPSLPTGSWVEQ